jgi:soluble lytic murein transglycosylase-like protein
MVKAAGIALILGGVTAMFLLQRAAQAAIWSQSYGTMPALDPDVTGDYELDPIYFSDPSLAETDAADKSNDTIANTGTYNQSVAFFDMNWKTNAYPTYAAAIAATEQQYGIPTDLLARLLFQESSYDPRKIDGTITSSKGAQGIAQFMPATAADLGVNPLDPVAAINAAGRYLAKMYQMFGNWQYALAAYNWGPGNMRKYLAGTGNKTMPPETSTYVAQITNDVKIMSA